MTSKKIGKLASDLLGGLEEATAYANGKRGNTKVTTFTYADAKAIREKLGMSQGDFCRTYGIPLNTLQNWEQRRNNPDRTASSYLWAIAALPRQIGKVHGQGR